MSTELIYYAPEFMKMFVVAISTLASIATERYLLCLYSPLFVVLFLNTETVNPVSLGFQTVLWDSPLMLWMRLAAASGARALTPFYSEISEHISVGSLPLNVCDIEFLTGQGVTLVVNLCREYQGLAEYHDHGVSHLYLPTPDFTEPSLEHVELACLVIQTHLKLGNTTDNLTNVNISGTATLSVASPKSKSRQQPRVFIHCKGGRGRAVTTALCWLLWYKIHIQGTRSYSIADAMTTIKARRSTAVSAVANYTVVRLFHAKLVEECVVASTPAARISPVSSPTASTSNSGNTTRRRSNRIRENKNETKVPPVCDRGTHDSDPEVVEK